MFSLEVHWMMLWVRISVGDLNHLLIGYCDLLVNEGTDSVISMISVFVTHIEPFS